MSERRPHLRRRSHSSSGRGAWKHEPPQSNKGRILLGSIIALGAVAALVMVDSEFALRDSLRRMAQGQEVPTYRVKAWADAAAVRGELADDLLAAEFSPSLEDRDTRRSLALHALIAATGDAVISRGGADMGALMQELCLDVDWLEEMVYFCPMVHAEAALPILAHIYRTEKKKMEGIPANRRLASAIAFEYARAGLDADTALAAYLFYAASGQKHWLNGYFAQLSLWEMRVIAARCTDAEWSRESTLAWFQRENRLPARGYVTLGDTVGAHGRCLFGTEVDTPDFLALYGDAAGGGIAGMYEAADCSTPHTRARYAATAACANGVPALVVENAEEAVCLVAVNGTWETSAPVPQGASASWSFCGLNHPDFIELAARLGREKEKTLAAARLAQMGAFHYGAGNQPLAHSFYREAVKVQPLHYAAWAGFHTAGAPQADMAGAAQAFEQLPGVAAALRLLTASAE